MHTCVITLEQAKGLVCYLEYFLKLLQNGFLKSWCGAPHVRSSGTIRRLGVVSRASFYLAKRDIIWRHKIIDLINSQERHQCCIILSISVVQYE